MPDSPSVRLASALWERTGDAETSPEPVWVDGAAALCRVVVAGDGGCRVEMDANVAERIGLAWAEGDIAGPVEIRRGFVVLLRMVRAWIAAVPRESPSLNADAERLALGAALDVWDALGAPERHATFAALDRPQLDSGHIFGRFLRLVADEGARERYGESPEAWQYRWVTWLLGQARVDLPYDRARVEEILADENLDPDESRLLLYQTVRDFDRRTERENAERIGREVAWAQEELIFGRMSRAFHNQALLFAHARYVSVTEELARAAETVAEAARRWGAVRAAADRVRLLVRTGEETPLTELSGAIDRLEEQALRHQRKLTEDALRKRRVQAETAARDAAADEEAANEVARILETSGNILTATGDLRARLLESPRRPAAYLIMSQRPSPTGSHLIAKINEGDEPFLGKPENLRSLVGLAGDRVYASPDYTWLRHANHWIEAIPLFIKERIRVVEGVETAETVIDQQGMEESFREHMADHWAINLRLTELSGYCALARALLFEEDGAAADLARGADFPRAWKASTDGRVDDVADLAAAIALAADAAAREITTKAESEGSDRLEATRDILFEAEADDGLWHAVRTAWAGNTPWPEAVAAALKKVPGETRAAFDAVRREVRPLSDVPRRPLPALHVLTTQSARMTDGYIRSWLEESMALANVVRAHGLETAVAGRMEAYRKEIETLGAALVHELGLGVEVDTIMVTEGVGRSAAIRRLVGASRRVQGQVSLLAVLRETARETGEGVDPPQVDRYLERFSEELERIALRDVVSRNAQEIARAAHELRETDPSLRAASEEQLHRRIVDANPDYRDDLRSFTRFAAREKLLADWDREYPEKKLLARRQAWLRLHQRLALTTARKEVISEHGLNHLTLDPRHYYRASGGAKRYHLLYTPSRVDLGPRERESVESWSQWVGGHDRAAAQVGRRVYGLINKSVKRFDSLTEPEVLKTGENASMASHFAYSNAMALMVNSTGRGDIEELGDEMSLREDRKIHPAGEGYGGYCVPKDGLFLEFVLTLTERVKLRQLGIEERYHEAVAKLAREVLHRREDFPTELAWEAWAERLLADDAAMGGIFSVKEIEEADGGMRSVPVFQITRLARVLDGLGQPPLREHRSVVKNLAARWGIHTMIAGAEHVNRFMAFYKTWLTYDALAHARSSDRSVPPADEAVVVLTAEYKPDTQDGRFAVGMRKYELFAGTGEHLRHSLGSEAGTLALLMLEGWDRALEVRGRNDSGLNRIAAQWGVDPHSPETSERMRSVFPGYPSPGEIRLVSPMGLSTQDVLRYTSDTRIEQAADEARERLHAVGLSDEDIRANMATFGPRLLRWAKLRAMPEAADLTRDIGGRIHALALAVLGPDRSYEHALQGADVFDVGIPHRQVMALLDEPAKLRDLMRYGRPNSALVIVDGASGARRRAMNRLGVMQWFAAAEQIERTSHYRSIGLGERTIENWRTLMRRRKARAEMFRERWRSGEAESVERAFRDIVGEIRDEQEALLALDEEERLTRFGRDGEQDHIVAELLVELARMESPRTFTFAHWLALGGLFILDGVPEADFDGEYARFRRIRDRLFGEARDRRPDGEVEVLVRKIAAPTRKSYGVTLRQEQGVESSNKATEEVTKISLDTRRQLAERARRMFALRRRGDAFDKMLHEARQTAQSLPDIIAAIRRNLGDPEEFASEERFGGHLALTRIFGERLVEEFFPTETEESNEIADRLRALLDGRSLDPEAVRLVCGSYEDIGATGRLAQTLVERAQAEGWPDERKRDALELTATLAEFIDVARAFEVTLADREQHADQVDASALWRRLATFFAETINDHFYEYRPWAYSRGVGFDEFRGDELYGLANRHHAWLYRYLRHLIVSRTELLHRSSVEQDLLLGRIADAEVIVAIGARGVTEEERRWRAYNQLREIAFIRNDGFPLPPVFNGFDPSLIDGDNRVNILCMYPVGRTHVSRMLAEQPTLARELVTSGQQAANIILTRMPKLDEPYIKIEDGHFYVDRETYVAALKKHWGLSDSGAKSLAERDVGPKGIRVAARFSRPITAAIVLPMHGNPLYDDGHLERLGLPYSIQSRFHTWTTYDKAKYPDIFTPETGVKIPDEIDWLREWTETTDEATAREQIRTGRRGTSFTGLEEFSRAHRIVMLKDAAESGGRSQKSFVLRGPSGEVDGEQMAEAVDFLHQISLHHNVAVQEIIISTPEAWATEEFLSRFTDRQIVEWHRPIERGRQPRTPLFGSIRIILSTDSPLAKDRVRHWHTSHRITLNSTQIITNVGRGGTLDLLRADDIQPEHREAIMAALDEAGRKTMEAMSAYEQRAASRYTEETGFAVGRDLTGVSYGVPRYLMLDFLVRPVFSRPGEVVEVIPKVDDDGTRIGSTFLLYDGAESFYGEITGWDVVLIEPNIGIGLWDRVAIREEEHERRRAEATGEPMDWDRVGENARIVLRDLTRAGAEYLLALAERAND